MACQLPEYVRELLEPHTYYALYGGRSSTKSWSMAHVLPLLCSQYPHKAIAARAVEKSIKLSHKSTIAMAIERMGLASFYKINETEIVGQNGSTINFRGLERQKQELKGLEGITLFWGDEASAISHDAGNILIPTLIRNAGVRIYFTFNPVLATDWIYDRFLLHPEEGDYIREVNWKDNPWLSEEAKLRIKRDYEKDPELAEHVWGGGLLPESATAAFRNYEGCFIDSLAPGPPVVIGVDLARTGKRGGDWTVVVGLNEQGQCCLFERWHGINSVEQQDRIKALVGDKSIPIIVDATGFGMGIAENIEIDGHAVEKFVFTYASKGLLMNRYSHALQTGQIGLLNTPETLQEHREYQRLLTNEQERYLHKAGMHDDIVDAYALAWHGYQQIYANRSITHTGSVYADEPQTGGYLT